jgi:hypothetical protein
MRGELRNVVLFSLVGLSAISVGLVIVVVVSRLAAG